jgi:hypothetical protein
MVPDLFFSQLVLKHRRLHGRVQSLEQQALLPVVAPAELGNVWHVVLTYLNTGRHIPTGCCYRAVSGDSKPCILSHLWVMKG